MCTLESENNHDGGRVRVLEIGPDVRLSRGGIATVIEGIRTAKELEKGFAIDTFGSYRDGSAIRRAVFSLWAYGSFRRRQLWKEYDLFHIHMAANGSVWRKGRYIRLLKKHHKKVILHLHSGKMIPFYEKLSPRRRERVRDILSMADLRIVLSDRWKEYYEDEMGIPECTVVRNGIDIGAYRDAATDPGAWNHSFLYLSRMCGTKGVYDLIEAVRIAASEVPDIHCVLAGDGEEERCREMIRDYGLEKQISEVGWADGKKKVKLLSEAGTVVLPSYFEGQPMCLLEGMAAGKAVISTWAGGIPELIEPDNGVLLEPGDVKGLAGALTDFCRNPEKVRSLGDANYKKVLRLYDNRKTYRELGEIFRDIYSEQNHGEQ